MSEEGSTTEESARAPGLHQRRGATGELCIHLLWVMLKALRAPPTYPSVWQLSLLDPELDTLLEFKEKRRETVERKRHHFLRRGRGRGGGVTGSRSGEASWNGADGAEAIGGEENSGGGGGDDDDNDGWDGPVGAQQQVITDADSCPICLDDFEPLSLQGENQIVNNQTLLQPITYCRPSCGNSVHVKCLLEYCEHAASSSYDPETFKVKCLMCRADWGPMALPWLRKHWAACQRRR